MMNRKTEKDIVLFYLNNLVRQLMPKDIENRVCNWFETHSEELIGRDIENAWDGNGYWNRSNSKKMPRRCATIRKLLEGKPGKLPAKMPIVSTIMESFHLAPKFYDVLALHVCIATIPWFGDLSTTYRFSDDDREIIVRMLGISLEKYSKYFSSDSELLTKGLFSGQDDKSGALKDILFSRCRTPEAIKRVVLGNSLKATLEYKDYDHIAEEYDWMKEVLASAAAKKERGVNILIYGEPGTGKTELVKSLCRDVKLSLHEVSTKDDAEQNSYNRRSNLASALCLLQGSANSVLMMDEAEDVFDASEGSGGFMGIRLPERKPTKSKLFFNRLLEKNPVPVIWVSNSIRGVDPAHLRRFSYTLEVEKPNEKVQARIWTKLAKKRKIKLSSQKVSELVSTYDIAPAIIDTSLRTAALTNNEKAIETTIESLQMAMTGRVRKKDKNSNTVSFSTGLLNCDVDLATLAEQVLALNGETFSLCLYGAPGTGKSAYARHLADTLGMKVLQKRASDLMSMYVGQNEKNIADAFADARRNNMLLIFDEADSFLQERSGAHRSWEVTQVNEMLTQMEHHPLPFICTTNLMDNMDKAALRRFTFKVKYDYLKAEQVKTAFEHFFGMKPTVSLTELTHLAPGDFAVVAKRAKICKITDVKKLVEMLLQEQSIKGIKREKTIGFVTR